MISQMELTLYLVLLVIFGTFVVAFGRPFFRGAPYAPTDIRTITAMMNVAKVIPSDRACDIGSGDGRLLIALAKKGAHAEGFEINPFLVLWSRMKIKKEHVEDKASVSRQNLWKADFRPYTLVYLFCVF